MIRKFPKIIIRYNLLIDPIFVFYCQNNPKLKKLGWDKWVPPSEEELLKRVRAYKEEWSKYEKKILKGVCDVFELNFKANIIDVYIVSGNPRSMSHPLIIKSCYPPDKFVDVLTHELIHRLIDSNGLSRIVYKVKKKYINESGLVKAHIIIHAILKYIYLDILKQRYRLNRSLLSSKKHCTDEYSRAWEIVKKDGYRKIISDFKSKYKKLKKR